MTFAAEGDVIKNYLLKRDLANPIKVSSIFL
jgi:hypothetical protein